MSKDRKIGLVSVLVGAVTVIRTMGMKVSQSGISAGDPGPKVFPYIGGILLILCGIGICLKKQEQKEEFMSVEQWKRMGSLFLTFAGYALGLYLVGFVIATPVLLYAMISMFAGDKKVSLTAKVVYCILVTAILYLAFVVLFKASVPTGLLAEMV